MPLKQIVAQSQLGLEPQIGMKRGDSLEEGVSRQLTAILSPSLWGRLRYMLGLTSQQNEINRLHSRLTELKSGIEAARRKYIEEYMKTLAEPGETSNEELTRKVLLYEHLLISSDQMIEHCGAALRKVRKRM